MGRGVAMSKDKNGYGRGTFVDASIFLSPAWMSLGCPQTGPTISSCSCQVLMLLLGKRKFGYVKDRHGQKVWQRTDDNRFTLTYKELETRFISAKRATRAIDELLHKGFIEIIDPGGAFNKHKAVYALTDDFLKWRPGDPRKSIPPDPPVRKRTRDVPRGFQGKIEHNGRARGAPQKMIFLRIARNGGLFACFASYGGWASPTSALSCSTMPPAEGHVSTHVFHVHFMGF